jgi:hypothetical protein
VLLQNPWTCGLGMLSLNDPHCVQAGPNRRHFRGYVVGEYTCAKSRMGERPGRFSCFGGRCFGEPIRR